jgi:hypothetical protein
VFSYFHTVLIFDVLGSERDMFSALQRQTCKEGHEMSTRVAKIAKKTHIAILCSKLDCTSSLLCSILNMKRKDKIGNTLQVARSRYAV